MRVSPMFLVAMLVVAHLPVLAQDSAPPAGEELMMESCAKKPYKDYLHHAIMAYGLTQVSTHVLVKYDADGRILDAKVEPSTRNRNLDVAIARWSRQIKLRSGAPGTGWFPIEMNQSR
jgi:hypothetical protein